MLASNVALPLPPRLGRSGRPTRRGTDRQRAENTVIGHIHNALPAIDENVQKGKRVYPHHHAVPLTMIHPERPRDDESTQLDARHNHNTSLRYHLRPSNHNIFPKTGDWTDKSRTPELQVIPRKTSCSIVHRRCKYDTISSLLDMGFTPDSSQLPKGPHARLLKNYPVLVAGKPW